MSHQLLSQVLVLLASMLLPFSVVAGSLSTFRTVKGTDYVVSGTGGMRGHGTGTIGVSGVTGVIRQAFLYWHGPTNSKSRRINDTVIFNGRSVRGTQIGFSNDNCWGFANSQAYRADVTNDVKARGNGSYSLSGFTKTDGSADVNGASLIVFFNDDNVPNDRDVVIFEGNDSNIENSYDQSGWNVALHDISYQSGTAFLRLIVSDGQDWLDDGLVVNSTTLSPTGAIFQGDLGPRTHFGSLWDIKTIAISPYLQSGTNSLRLRTGAFEDCLSLVVAIVDLPSGAVPCIRGEALTNVGMLRIREGCGASEDKLVQIAWCKEGEECGNPDWRDSIESESGERLVLGCDGLLRFGAYRLRYQAPDMEKALRVGLCPFENGCNSAYFTYSDKNRNGTPDCFGKIFWLSEDRNKNDQGPNPWTWEWMENPERFDVAASIFDVASRFLTKRSFKYEYRDGEPPSAACGSAYTRGRLVGVSEVDPPLGPETEAFFDAVEEGMAAREEAAPASLPMGGSELRLGDVDSDGLVGYEDLNLLRNSLGTCGDDEGFEQRADLDLDGCVSASDEELFRSGYVNGRPSAEAGEDQSHVCTTQGGVAVTLNGSASLDPDRDPLSYVWRGSFGERVGEQVVVVFSPGKHTVTLDVDDGYGGMSQDTVEITVSRMPGDIDGDCDVDREDVAMVMGARNRVATAGDPRDLDGDGKITVIDARRAALLCTRPSCATQ